MITLKIKKGQNKAEVWVQELTIAGIITDNEGEKTFLSKVFFNGTNLVEFFKYVKDRTGIDFDGKKKSNN